MATGTYALYLNSTGSNNIASGSFALYANSLGNNNIANGFESLISNKTASNNIAIGNRALWSQNFTNGGVVYSTDNVAIGHEALYTNNPSSGFDGQKNTAIGNEAIRNNLTGAYNTAIGKDAMKGLAATPMTGYSNIAVGMQSLHFNVSGSANTAIGNNALNYNNSGDYNVGIGYQSLFNNSIGNSNIAIGFQAGYSETGSNKLYIENSNSTTPLIYGEFDTNLARINGNFRINSTTVPGDEMQVKNSNLYIHGADANLNFGAGSGSFMMSTQDASAGNETGGIRGDGDNVSIWSPGDGGRQLRILDEDAWNDNNGNPYDNGAEVAYIAANGQYFQVSDKNKKESITKIEDASNKISKISGYTYQYKLKQQEIEKGQKSVSASGVLAQEIEQVLPEAIQKNESGEYFVDYAAITPLLIEAIKEQSATIKLLEERLKKLEEK